MTAGDSETIATQKLYAYAQKYTDFNDELNTAADRQDADAPYGRIEVKSLGLDEAALTGRRNKVNGMQMDLYDI